MEQRDYAHWTVQDFLADTHFQDWVAAGCPGHDGQWKEVAQRFPGAAVAMQEARDLLLGVKAQPRWPDHEGEVLVWQEIQSAIRKKEQRVFRLFTSWQKAAAVLLPLILVAGVLTWTISRQKPQMVQASAERGTFKVIALPDASQVTLGANSNIRFSRNWAQSEIREVWLDGDAHFEVKHINKDTLSIKEAEKFLVHVNDELEVEVLGTVFNIRNKNGQVNVELESGKVKVRTKKGNKEVVLLPGEMASVKGGQLEVAKKATRLGAPAQAHDQLYELNNTSVAEIIQLVEKVYQKKVVVKDSSLLERRIDGVLPLCHENDLLFALSGILDIQVDAQPGGVLVFRTAE